MKKGGGKKKDAQEEGRQEDVTLGEEGRAFYKRAFQEKQMLNEELQELPPPKEATDKTKWKSENACCAYPGVGKEYRCNDEAGVGFPSHCPCACHKEQKAAER